MRLAPRSDVCRSRNVRSMRGKAGEGAERAERVWAAKFLVPVRSCPMSLQGSVARSSWSESRRERPAGVDYARRRRRRAESAGRPARAR